MLILGKPPSPLQVRNQTNRDPKAYFVHKIPPQNNLAEAKLTLGGVVSVLTVYIFAFSFSVSLGPISWNVCSEVRHSHFCQLPQFRT